MASSILSLSVLSPKQLNLQVFWMFSHIFLKLCSSWLDEKGWMEMDGYIVNSVVSFASGS